WAELAEQYNLGALEGGHLDRLSHHLKVVSSETLDQIGVGYCSDYATPCRGGGEAVYPPHWTSPELDSSGRVVGIHVRYHDGKKEHRFGGGRGLVYDPVAVATAKVAICVEGLSDTAAGMSLGLRGVLWVGRPSNTAGGEMLAELIAPAAWAHGTDIL